MASAMSQPGDRQVVIATISSTSDIDHAIARLVLAFSADPVARWMYDDPYKYLLHIPRLFRALGAAAPGALKTQYGKAASGTAGPISGRQTAHRSDAKPLSSGTLKPVKLGKWNSVNVCFCRAPCKGGAFQ